MALRRTLALPLVSLALLVADARVSLGGPPPSATGASAAPAPVGSAATAATAAVRRWTDATPDTRINAAVAHAATTARDEHAHLAAMAVVDAIAPRATEGQGEAALGALAASARTLGLAPDVRDDALLLARALAADEGTNPGAAADHALGVVTALSILGPFRDTGGGLDAHDGPESRQAGATPFAPTARYSWGTVEVAWRQVPRGFAQASGTPLNLFVSPRKESCAWVATHLSFSGKQSVRVYAASTGQVRLVLDGVDVARDDDVHESLRFDRIGGKVDVEAGDHLLAAKVCTGALDDDGQVRLRVTDDAGAWPAGVTESANLTGAWRPKKPAVHPMPTALSRAIARPGDDVDARLDASILRTLGGADDLRSPRAPGLLAALAEGTLDADRLAMAAWIAPERREPQRVAEPRARARATRAPGPSSPGAWSSGTSTRTWPTGRCAALPEADIDQARDGEAALLSAQVDVALGIDSLRIRADAPARGRGARRPQDGARSRCSSRWRSLSESVAQRGVVGPRPAARRAASAAPNRVRVVAHTGDRDALLAAAKAAFAGGLADADDAIEVARDLAAAGAHDEARALFEQAAAWAPNRRRRVGRSGAGDRREPGRRHAPATRGGRPFAARASSSRARPATAPSSPCGPHPRERRQSHDDEKYLVYLRHPRAPAGVAQSRRPRSTAPGDRRRKAAPAVAHRAATRPTWPTGSCTGCARSSCTPTAAFPSWSTTRARSSSRRAPTTSCTRTSRPRATQTEIVRARVHRKDGTEAFPLEEASDDAQPAHPLAGARPRRCGRGGLPLVDGRPRWRPRRSAVLPPRLRRQPHPPTPFSTTRTIIESPADRPIYVGRRQRQGRPGRGPDDNGRHVVRLRVGHARRPSPTSRSRPPLSEVMPDRS